MKKNILHNFYIPTDKPLDSKTVISSISNLDNELPIHHRYLGLIFFNEENKQTYIFDNNLNVPNLLVSNITNTQSIYVENYGNIASELEKYNSLGNMLWVFPVNVLYYYNGNEWKYLRGTYNLRNTLDLNNIPQSVIELGSDVTFNNELYVWNKNKTLTLKYSITNNQTNLDSFNNQDNYIDNQYFEHGKQLFQIINGLSYKIGSRIIYLNNFTLNKGYNKLYEFSLNEIGNNVNPPYTKAILWINKNIDLSDNEIYLNQIELDIFFKKTSTHYELLCNSQIDITGNIELIF